MKKLQKNKLDPIGIGDYARAYEYTAFSKVQEHWEDAFKEAEIHYDVRVTLADVGAIE
ncbi:spore germination B3/GerAC like protein [Paenibacillus cellulosilyticus]|uniref:Spore germination B3/GerAC like protein n=1 Tax=Paenibacillus cellulosilyticus TaxID=375489 RepID=A0A2V2YQK9_9BACL|nr:spore germination B3/GerAC like protein [Paenibacillus cellulosilyticus]